MNLIKGADQVWGSSLGMISMESNYVKGELEVNHMVDNSIERQWKTPRCDSKLLSARWRWEHWSSYKWQSVNVEDEQHQLFMVSIQLGKLPKSVTKLEGVGRAGLAWRAYERKGKRNKWVIFICLKEWREEWGREEICQRIEVFLEKLPGENKEDRSQLGVGVWRMGQMIFITVSNKQE